MNYKRNPYYTEEQSEEPLSKGQKIFLWSLFLIGLIVMSVGFGSAVECSANIENGCNIASSFTFNRTSIFSFNSSTSNNSLSAINISASNIIIDLNGSTIIGNWTNTILGTGNGSKTAFFLSTFQNITIKNGKIFNYEKGIYQFQTANGLHNIINITFNNTNQGVHMLRPRNNVYNSTFINSYQDAIRFEGASSSHNWIEGNTCIGGADCVSLSSTGDNSGNNTVRYNRFLDGYSKYGIILSRSNNNLIEYNNFSGRLNAIGLTGLNTNTTIRFNIISNTSNGTIGVGTDCAACFGITQYSEVGLDDNLTIYNNTFYNLRDALVLANVSQTFIFNNYFENVTNRPIRLFNLDNLSFYNNTFNNLTQDIVLAKTNIATFPNYYLQGNVFINSIKTYNFISNLTSYFYDYQDYLLLNSTFSSNPNISLSNLVNALIYFSNSSVACSNIATCDNNINITLTPNNYSYVLDNFNLTEGVTRQFSPLSISGSSTSKTITSSLTQSINATVVVNVGSCSFDATYNGNGVQEQSCGGGIATFTLTDIPAGTSQLTLVYLDIDCSTNTSASIIIILAFSALAIVALSLILVARFKEGELDIKTLIIVFIEIIVGLVLFTQIAQLTGSVCS